MRLLLCLLLSLATQSVYAQDDDEMDLTNLNHKYSIKLTPTSLCDPAALQIPVGLEYYFGKVGLYMQYGMPLLKTNRRFGGDGNMDITSDTKIKLELRKYLLSPRYSRFYLAIEISDRVLDINCGKGSYTNYYNGEISSTSFTSAKLRRNQFDSGIDFGGMHKLYKHCCFEWYAGIGVRLANGEYSDVQNAEEGAKSRRFTSFTPRIYDISEKGSYTWLYPAIGLRLSYLLGK